MQETVKQGLKILYSLDEIKENGFEIKAEIPKKKRCPYCNKTFEPKGILDFKDNSIRIFLNNDKCNCTQSKIGINKIDNDLSKQLLDDFEKYRKEEVNKRIKQYYGMEFITENFKKQTLESFIVNDKKKITKLAAEKFLRNFIEMKKGIIFEGTNGIGKTHIAIAICNELIIKKVPVIFGTLSELMEKYKKSYKNFTDIELTKLYSKVDLLVIDDLGVETMNDWMLSKLFVIINERMKNELPIIITTNYDIEQLRKRLSIPNKVCETTNSIISRLCQICYRVECKGNDYRMNNY